MVGERARELRQQLTRLYPTPEVTRNRNVDYLTALFVHPGFWLAVHLFLAFLGWNQQITGTGYGLFRFIGNTTKASESEPAPTDPDSSNPNTQFHNI